MLGSIIIIMLIVIYPVGWTLVGRAVDKNGDWHAFYAWKARRLIDGTMARSFMRRRWSGTDWQYRATTDEEWQSDSDESNAW